MTFDGRRFLSSDIETFRRKIRREYKDLFKCSDRLNGLANQWKFKCDVRDRDVQSMVIFCLFLRILDTFAAVYRLTQIGLCNDAHALCRVELEALFILAASKNSEEFVINFVRTDQKNRLKLLNVAQRKGSSLHDLFKADETDLSKLYQDLRDEVKNQGIEDQFVEETAKTARLHEMYDYAYRILCGYVHTSPRILSNYIVWDERDQAKSFHMEPFYNSIPRIMFTNLSVLIHALASLGSHFDLPDKELQPFIDEFKTLDKSYSTYSSSEPKH